MYDDYDDESGESNGSSDGDNLPVKELSDKPYKSSFRMNSDDDSYFINMDRDFVVLLQEDFNVLQILGYLTQMCERPEKMTVRM